MESIKTLFSIALTSDYFKDNIVRGIKIYPDSTCKNFFKRYNINFIEKNNRYELIWFIKKIQNTDACFKQLFQGVKFKFFLSVENIEIFKFLNIQHNKIYNFVNNSENLLLHKEEYVSSEDLSDCKDYADKIFGFINIDMDILLQENDILNIEKNYRINIPTIESFWEIKLVDHKNQIKKINDLLINEKKCDFEDITNDDEHVLLSKNETKLKEVGINSLAFFYTTKTNIIKQVSLSAPICYSRIIDNNKYISTVSCNL